MKERKSFLLRISPALYEALEAWAQQELRSVNGQIEYVLKEAVARRKRSLSEGREAAHREDAKTAEWTEQNTRGAGS